MPSPCSIGSKYKTPSPTIMARVVMIIGLTRSEHAFKMASFIIIPSAIWLRAKSTSRMELRKTIPASAITPTVPSPFRAFPSSAWAGITPIKMNGIGSITMIGVRNEPYQATSMAYIMKSTATKAIPRSL